MGVEGFKGLTGVLPLGEGDGSNIVRDLYTASRSVGYEITYCVPPGITPFAAEPGVFAPIGDPFCSIRPTFGVAGEEKLALRLTEPVALCRGRPFAALGVN